MNYQHNTNPCTICGKRHKSTIFKSGFICEDCIKYLTDIDDI